MSRESQTMLAVLLVVGLTVGAGLGYFMAPSGDGGTSGDYNDGYRDGYNAASAQAGASGQSADVSEQLDGLRTLTYGAIGAALISALASIVTLMQVSRRIG